MSRPSPLEPDLSRHDWTVEEVNSLPDDGNRYEVIDGELLVSPAPSWLHQRVIGELYLYLKPYSEAHSLECIISPAAVTFSTRREVQPDIFVVPTIAGGPARTFADVGRLLLAVEVISPYSVRADRFRKQALFQSEGVPEYWIVDAAMRVVERWRPGDAEPDVLLDTLEWKAVDGGGTLVIPLAKLFDKVHGELGAR